MRMIRFVRAIDGRSDGDDGEAGFPRSRRPAQASDAVASCGTAERAATSSA